MPAWVVDTETNKAKIKLPWCMFLRSEQCSRTRGVAYQNRATAYSL